MIPAWTSASVKGSTAVEFSGHTTKSGCGCSPAATASASSWVSRTWLAVTSRWTATTSSPVPGTSPCTAATVVVAGLVDVERHQHGRDGHDGQPGQHGVARCGSWTAGGSAATRASYR